MPPAPPSRAPLFLALGAVLLWSTVASAFELALRELSPTELLLWAGATASGLLWAAVLLGGRWRDLRAWGPGDLARAAGLGLLNPFLYYLILFRAYDLLPAQQAQPLNYVWPIALAALTALATRTPLPARAVAGMATSLAGVAVIATRGRLFELGETDPVGVALALGSSVVWAVYWTAAARAAGDPVARLAVGFTVGSLAVAAVVALDAGLRVPSAGALAAAAWAGVAEMGLTFLLWLEALRRAKDAAQVARLAYLAPFLSLVLLRFVVGERIHPSAAAGLALVVAGILLAGGRRRPR